MSGSIDPFSGLHSKSPVRLVRRDKRGTPHSAVQSVFLHPLSRKTLLRGARTFDRGEEMPCNEWTPSQNTRSCVTKTSRDIFRKVDGDGDGTVGGH